MGVGPQLPMPTGLLDLFLRECGSAGMLPARHLYRCPQVGSFHANEVCNPPPSGHLYFYHGAPCVDVCA